ncbi:MAG: DUF4332 domain-containing protein [Spirochaetales bacterium]|nr:DUF4332 domain-containing protein [Leptospiraceae bacterium]MCP5481406.1 DUF4332 domain-containing protein [Spirochaetales bacterium]MCP5486050.1 DUF4332 domain-containing protein [Spirochaetales bacterium]
MAKLEYVEGIGKVYAKKLNGAGVRSTQALLRQGATPEGRKAISKAAGVSDKLLLEWINHVDLFRITGVGEEYADLLEEAGVDTVPELAQRKPEHLHEALKATNDKKKLVRQLPGLGRVKAWVAEAKKLPRVIKY